jgi:predicted membrane channel-forming protein YqfA (hemolysin III family)
MRVLIETLHIVVGLIAAVLVATAAAWSYPRATNDIWLVTYVAMAAVVLMGVGPLRKAYAIDKAGLKDTRP